MIVCLENDICKVSFSTIGAELVSFISKDENIERVWQGDERIWTGQAPLLFPFIGRLKDGEFTHNGQSYKIPSHGFARKTEFEIKEQSDKHVVFELLSNDTTKTMYPFDFALEIIYSLEGNALTKTHRTTNTGDETMYYEVGGHDGYAMCFAEGECMEDYYLELGEEVKELDLLCFDQDIMILKETRKVAVEQGIVPLSMKLFEIDAWVIHNPSFKKVRMKCKKNDKVVTMNFSDFNTMAFWTKYVDYDTNYLCFEPWSSLPDCAYLGKDIKDKVDIRVLEVGQSEELKFTTIIE